jgi:hypothetical protein
MTFFKITKNGLKAFFLILSQVDTRRRQGVSNGVGSKPSELKGLLKGIRRSEKTAKTLW